MIVTEGLNFITRVALDDLAKASAIYVGLYKNNYTPLLTDVALTFPGVGVANEATTEYDEATRVVWTPVTTNGVINNYAAPAVFTFNSTVDIYGAFLATTSTKGGTTGKLIAAGKFTAKRAMENTFQLSVKIQLTFANAA